MCREKWKAQSLYERQHGERRNGINQTGVITSAKSRDKFFSMSAVTVSGREYRNLALRHSDRTSSTNFEVRPKMWGEPSNGR